MDKPDEASDDSAVDIPGLFAALRNRRKLIAVITGCCLLAGILYVVIAANEYQSKAEVLPEVNNSPTGEFGQLLQSYGGLLGINNLGINNASNKQYISPTLYPVIIRSLSFQTQMLQDTIYFAEMDSSMTLYQYFSGLKDKNDDLDQLNIPTEKVDFSGISRLTKPQMQAVKEMRERIDITFEGGTGVMNVEVLMPDAVAAAQVCRKVIEKLKGIVKEYHTRKAKDLLEYSNKQYQNAKTKFLTAQHKLATFKDEHTNLAAATAQSRLKYLRSKYNLAYNLYNSVSQKRVEARMRLQKLIPIFNIIQHPNVPLHRYSPRWIPVLLISIAVGLVLSFLVVSGLFIYRKWES